MYKMKFISCVSCAFVYLQCLAYVSYHEVYIVHCGVKIMQFNMSSMQSTELMYTLNSG